MITHGAAICVQTVAGKMWEREFTLNPLFFYLNLTFDNVKASLQYTFPYVAQPERLKSFQVLFILQRLGNSHGNNLFDGDMHDTKVFKMIIR